jgi:hypothetical protein
VTFHCTILCWTLSIVWGIFDIASASGVAILSSSGDWLSLYWQILYYIYSFYFRIGGDSWDQTWDLLNSMLGCQLLDQQVTIAYTLAYCLKGPISIMTTFHLKMAVEPTPETLCISAIPQTVDSVQRNIGITLLILFFLFFSSE